jgi:4a-hydroxytetrahydrobiopterin dehydratase
MKLSTSKVDARLKKLPGWSRQADSISRLYTFKGFPDAVAFITRLGFDAEAADHHPDLQVSYRKVTVTWSTHSAGGVTEKDFEGVRQSDTIAKALGA